jgi:transposase
MTTPTLLSDDLWNKLLQLLRYQPNIYIGNEAQCRRFIEAVLWIDRTGAQWRMLPSNYGHWNSVFKRFDRWSRRGIWQQLYQRLITEPDLENLLMDSTIFRAHACAAGAKGGRQLKR